MNMDETTEQCAIRELEEETGIAEWWPLSDLPHLAFDHYSIMQDAVALFRAMMNIE
jgi:8-oxo-dGTP diphosphatase